MRSVELFTGAGGLAIGTAMAGFHHESVVELNRDCCETLRVNKAAGHQFIGDWNIVEADVRTLDYTEIGQIDMIAGGVPCQPFSLGGKHKAHEDERDMFPEFARAVAITQPKAFMIENVKGLLRATFADYFEYVILRLSHPLVTMKDGRTWREHRAELERIHTSGVSTELDYNVVFQLLNAADYGVPQKRERVFIVGFRTDLRIGWTFPSPTHSREALLRQQLVTGEYWDRHSISKKFGGELVAACPKRSQLLWTDDLKPWRTVRDAIADLPKVKLGQPNPSDPNHFLNPGARSYKGHTGSPWDEPAKTLKAGDHGVPGGENTLALEDGSVRYFSPRECARLQTFPDEFQITGTWTEQMRQMGNAVPVRLAEIVAQDIAKKINPEKLQSSDSSSWSSSSSVKVS